MLWVVAVSAILIVYRVYNRVTGTVVIDPPEKRSSIDMPIPEFDSDAPKIGDASLGTVKDAVYTFCNPDTNELERIFGFEKLLKAEKKSNIWPLVKPYMTMYNDGYTCKVKSDRGTVQVETVNNNPNPTEAQLYDNVVIHIISTDPANPGDSYIYMDTLVYDSERSEISTEGPIRFVSDNAEMVGKGMILIFNEGQNRIEFLKINDLEYVRLKDVSDMTVTEGKADSQEAVVAGDTGSPVAVVAKNAPEKETVKSDAAEKAVASTKKPDETAAPKAKDGELYQCILTKDVFIQYGNKQIVEGVENIHIVNILLGGSEKKKKAPGKEPAPVAEKTEVASNTVVEVTESSKSPKGNEMVGAVNDRQGVKASAAADSVPDTQPAAEVYITCKGGIVAKPMTSVYENTEPSRAYKGDVPDKRPVISRLAKKNTHRKQDLFIAQVPQWLQSDLVSSHINLAQADQNVEVSDSARTAAVKPPDRFKGKRIEYDMTTGNGTAYGPVEVIFYPDPNENSDPNVLVLPMVMTASRDAKFYSNSQRDIERVVFNKDVVGTRKVIRPEYLQANTFYGDKLTINIEPNADNATNGDIKDVSVTEGNGKNVRMESIRTAADVVISHVRLSCLRFDFDAARNIVYAVGPGDIQMNNSNAPEPTAQDKAGSLSFQRPCYGLVRGFDKLTWFTDAMQINADGKEDSLFMAYWPIEKGQRGLITRGSMTHLQANFMTMPDGTNELATLITAGGIYYEEEGGNVFVGEDLLYEAENSLLKITSSEKNACLLNGALVDGIEYEVDTGNVRSELVATPGALAMPVRK